MTDAQTLATDLVNTIGGLLDGWGYDGDSITDSLHALHDRATTAEQERDEAQARHRHARSVALQAEAYALPEEPRITVNHTDVRLDHATPELVEQIAQRVVQLTEEKRRATTFEVTTLATDTAADESAKMIRRGMAYNAHQGV